MNRRWANIRFILSCLLLIAFNTAQSQSEPNQAIKNYVSQYFADLNNLGDNSLTPSERRLFIPQIEAKYFNPRIGPTIIENHISSDGSKEVKGQEYLYLIFTSYNDGVVFKYDSLRMISFNPDDSGFELKLALRVEVVENGSRSSMLNQEWVLEGYVLSSYKLDARIKSISTFHNGNSDKSVSLESGYLSEYFVITGAFGKLENAEKQKRRLLNLGYSKAEVVQFSGSRLYWVMSGRYTTKAESSCVAEQLKSQHKVDCFVKKKRPIMGVNFIVAKI